jgi:hypothetical protein
VDDATPLGVTDAERQQPSRVFHRFETSRTLRAPLDNFQTDALRP